MASPVTPQPPQPGAPQPPAAAAPPPVQQPQPPQPGQPGYDPNQVPTAQLREQVGAMPPDAQAPGVQPQAPATPPPGIQRPVRQADGSFVLETPWRSRYVGRTEQEVYDQVYSAQANAVSQVQNITRDRDRLRTIAQQAVGASLDERGQQVQQPEQFSPEIYRTIAQQDPITAQWYALQHMFKFDSIEEAQERLPHFFDVVERIEQNMTVADFHRMAPEFPATPQAVDALMNEFERTGAAFTPENLVHVHRSLMYAHSLNPQVGYAPLGAEGQPAPGAPPPIPPTNEPADPRVVMSTMLNPQGMYRFSPDGGFGGAPTPATGYPPAPPSNVAIPAYAPPAPAAPGYPPPPAAAAYPPAPSAYPPAPAAPAYYYPPAAPAVPVPPLNAAPGYGAPAAFDSNALYGMEKSALREFVERSAGR